MTISRSLLALNVLMVGVTIFSFIHIGPALFAYDVPLRVGIAQRPVVPAACSETTRRQSRSSRTDGFWSGRANRAARAEVGARRRGDRDDSRVAFIHGLGTNRSAGFKLWDTLAGRRLEGIAPRSGHHRDVPIAVTLHRPKDAVQVAAAPEEVSPRRSRGRQE